MTELIEGMIENINKEGDLTMKESSENIDLGNTMKGEMAMSEMNGSHNATIEEGVVVEATNTPVQELEYHELALKFNRLPAAKLQELANDIEKNGLLEKITIEDGKILDGVNRYEALRSKGKDPETIRKEYCQEYQGNTPALFVLSKNLYRRHEDLNDSQRAILVADMETYTHGGNRKNQEGSIHLATRKELAKTACVSSSSVARAKMIKDSNPEKAQDIRDGKTTIGAVVRKIKKEAQRTNVELTQSALSPDSDEAPVGDAPCAFDENKESVKTDLERVQEIEIYLNTCEQTMDSPAYLHDWVRRWVKLKIKNSNNRSKQIQ